MTQLSWNKLLNRTRSKDLLNEPTESKEHANNEEGDQKTGDTKDYSIDRRSSFERDYDRTLFSPPVRRLHDKAQVFPLEPNDSVRTRGTHSMEVANLAKSIINRLRSFFEEKELSSEEINQVRSIAETCGVLHDLGNPPFGHAGEKAMQGWFKKAFNRYSVDDRDQRVHSIIDTHTQSDKIHSLGDYLKSHSEDDLTKDFLEFDGNAQTIRLVTKLQMLADFSGLNLTAGTLAAALKYTARSDDINENFHPKEKPGFFFSEIDVVKAVREATDLGKLRHPIAYIVEACDDMVYSVVDIEDGIKKQVIGWKDLEEAFKGNETGERLLKEADNNMDDRLKKANPYSNNLSVQGRDEARAQLFRTYAIGEHVAAAAEEFVEHYNVIMNGTYGSEHGEGELLKDSKTSSFLKICKTFAREEIFSSSSIITRESKGRHIISDLMDFFWEGARHTRWESGEVKVEGDFAKRAYNLMSENYKLVFERDMSLERVDQTGLPREYRQLQLVADYICGMTDSFAQSLHKSLYNG